MSQYDVLDPAVEQAACFGWNKSNYAKYGRIGICDCDGGCGARQRVLQFVGICVELVVELNTHGFEYKLQQLIGSKARVRSI